MGNEQFKQKELKEREIKKWVEHIIQFDSQSRRKSLELLAKIKNGEPLYIEYQQTKNGFSSYQHWFITNGTYYIEFKPEDSFKSLFDMFRARVHINEFRHNGFHASGNVLMDDKVRGRIRHVLGMSNFSFCLRNSEHVVNYIVGNKWISYKAAPNGSILKKFDLNPTHNHMVNKFPSFLEPYEFGEDKSKLYSFIPDDIEAKGVEYYLDYNEKSYNVLMIGSTGAGKSNLINVIFNRKICKSETSHLSVSRDIYFFRGQIGDKEVVIADTVGLCDSESDTKNMLDLIKSRIDTDHTNFDLVFIVFKADRQHPVQISNMKRVIKWLEQSQSKKIRCVYVVTFAEFLSDQQKAKLSQEASELLAINDAETSTIYTGFIPENALNEQTRDRVKKNRNAIIKQITTDTPKRHVTAHSIS